MEIVRASLAVFFDEGGLAVDKEYKISISPEILELLGPSLYTNIYYILAELIANAYDADAQNVYIIDEENAIVVEDDGIGMDYAVGVKRYLQVAKTTRTDTTTSYTAKGRRRMGRKGIGKLAALSVSPRVKIISRSDGDISGFILSRNVPENGLLEPLKEGELTFRKISGNGTSVVMENPEYRLNKTLASWEHNILRLFPIVSQDFRIHLIQGTKERVLDSFDENIIPQLSTLITVGDSFKHLEATFKLDYPEIKDSIVVHYDNISETVEMMTNEGHKRFCNVSIEGWIGTYRSVAGRKKNIGDFPDNFISLFANGKLGMFNIIPEIGRNRMSESYVVGQFHIDSFEESDLPDMAMSNRQGYKTDDPRYQVALQLIRTKLFDKVLNMRDAYTDRKSKEKQLEKLSQEKECEKKLRQEADSFVARLQDKIEGLPSGSVISKTDANSIVNDAMPLLGLKRSTDMAKKKILISHATDDKDIADLIYDLLLYNDIDPSEIIYTNSTHEESRIPEGTGIFDYLRDFFVQSISSQMLNVIFVTSDASAKRWSPVCEVGAAWVTRASHKVFTVNGYTPHAPLDVNSEWLNFKIINDEIHLSARDADVLKVKTREICNLLRVTPRSDIEITSFIKSRVVID